MRYTFSFFLFIFLVAAIQIVAQTHGDRLVLYSLSDQNGLSDNRVTCFFQDSYGFMWIGTQDGLNRYDGSVIKKYRSKKDDTTTLRSNYISAITEDANHDYWIATLDGLSKFDAELNTFTTYHIKTNRGNGNLMWDLRADAIGNIWLASEVGLLQFIIKEHRFVIHYNETHDESPLRRADNHIVQVHQDKKGRLWLSTFNGLWQFHFGENKFEQVTDHEAFDLINTIAEDHTGNLWLGYWGKGIRVYDPEKKTTRAVSGQNVPLNVYGIAEAKNLRGKFNIWCSNLVAIDEEGNAKRYFPTVDETESNFIQSKLYVSQDGLLWISDLQGVKIMDPGRQFFIHHYLTPNKITPQSIALLQKGKQLYVGGNGTEFLTLYDSAFKVIKKTGSGVESIATLNIVREDATHIWLCTESGLVLLNEVTGEQKDFHLTQKESNTPARNFFTNMFIDSRGKHWVFPWRSGIWQVDINGKFKKIMAGFPTREEEIKKLVVSSALEDEVGNVWFADLDEGLILFNRSDSTFTKPTAQVLGAGYRLLNIEYEKPYLWFVISGEVIRIHTTTRAIEQWHVPEELNKTVSGFCSDLQGRLWITTSSGLLSFNKKTHEFNRFTSNDGLINNDMMDGVITCLGTGKILYADENYITEFDPTVMLKSAMTPTITITELFSQNKEIQVQRGDDGKKYIYLDYSYNNFTFHWALLNYSNPLQNHYYCKLDEVDKEWRYVGNTGQAQYASLAPGHYVFRARGATSDGVANKSDDLLFITIRPPFWKTWWFVLLSSFVISVTVYIGYRYRLNQVLMQERLRSKISTDLHDDIGSTLSSISILGDLALHRMSHQNTSGMIREIRDNAQMLMEKMDDIVWGINPDNDSLEKLLLRVKRFAAQLFEAKNIEYSIDVQNNIQQLTLTMEYRQHIFLILKESINNIIKHADCTIASIAVNYEQNHLKVIITDNGKVFDPNFSYEGNGLSSMKKRAESMKAILKIESDLKHGNCVSLQVKIK